MSIRFGDEERELLSKFSGNKPLSTYVREFVIKEHGIKTKRTKAPSVDRQEVARALSVLGRSELAPLLREALSAIDEDVLLLDWKTESDLRVACAELSAMRRDLMTALGLRNT